MKKILVSGIQPSGDPHIGNYFGMMKQCIDMQETFDARICIVNLHALTSLNNPEELKKHSFDVALDFLGAGLDPKKATLFLQSDIPHVTELAWIFNCITTMPYLMRAHAFKDAEAKNKEINVGKFDYPMLMAADVLVHDADIVPVGQDQKQHIEIMRDTAEKFNRVFGDTFKVPNPHILDTVATVPGIDGEKMSKSYGNTIPLFASDEEIEKRVMAIVTDSSGEIPKNVYAIHSLFRDKDYLDTLYNENKGKYKVLKDALIADLKAFITPMRERRKDWEQRPDDVKKILIDGGMKMRKIVHEKMTEVREKVGLIHHE